MIKKNDKLVCKIYNGENTIERIYKGTDKVYEFLPIGYKECKYIESTGTQYIDTNLYANKSTKVNITATLLESQSVITSGLAQLFGVVDSAAGLTINASLRSTAGTARFGAGITEAGTLLINYNEKHIYENSQNGLYLDGVLKYTWTTQSDFTSPNTMLLGRALGSSSTPNWQIYSCKIYNNNILVRNMIPCLDNNDIPCLYDLVSKTTFYNVGTGTFEYELK